jgi:hypothetical protein
MNLARLIGLSFAAAAAAVPPSQTGLKIVTLERSPHGDVETIDYVRSDRRRTETRTPGGEFVHITRCDRQLSIGLDMATRTYRADPIRLYPNVLVRLIASVAALRKQPGREPTLLVETTTVDTGERKTAFGYVARRVRITRRDIPLDGGDTRTEMETDGWYVDVEARAACERYDTHTLVIASRGGERSRVPVVTFRDIGERERGLPVELTRTWRSGRHADDAISGSRRVVTELRRMPVEDALFDAPRSFKPAEGRLAALAASWTRNWQMVRSLFD